MSLFIKLAGKVLSSEVQGQLRKFVALRLVKPTEVLKVGALMLLTLFFEAFGVAMILPLFQFIESGQDIQVLTEKYRMWEIIEVVFNYLYLPVNLLSLSIVIIFLIFLRQIFNYKNIMVLVSLKQRIGRDLSALVFSRVLESRPSMIQQLDSGHFINIVDVQSQAAASLVRSYSTLAQHIATFVVYASIMIWAAPMASMLALGFTVMIIFSLSHYVRLGRRLSQDMVQARRDFCSFVGERFQGWRVIKLSNAVPREVQEFSGKAEQIYDLTVNIFRATGRIQLIVTPVMSAFALIVLYTSVEHFGLSISQISLFIIILLRLIPTAQTFASQRQSIAEFGVNLNHVVETIENAAQNQEIDEGKIEFTNFSNEIRFHDVSFGYADEKDGALREVNARIPAGKLTAIMGPSGAGKSTLVDLLVRLIVPTDGSVTIDGQPLDSYSLTSIRDRISYTSQVPFIFNASVRENLLLASPSATQEEIENACKMAFAHEFIEEMPEKYETVLGEGGGRLSGGQRQRIALARSFLAQSKILILDEPTSSLDYDSEQKIQKALDKLIAQGDVTIIVVAHRLSTIQNADHLIVLQSGQAVEEGHPDVLKENPNWYGYISSIELDT